MQVAYRSDTDALQLLAPLSDGENAFFNRALTRGACLRAPTGREVNGRDSRDQALIVPLPPATTRSGPTRVAIDR